MLSTKNWKQGLRKCSLSKEVFRPFMSRCIVKPNWKENYSKLLGNNLASKFSTGCPFYIILTLDLSSKT